MTRPCDVLLGRLQLRWLCHGVAQARAAKVRSRSSAEPKQHLLATVRTIQPSGIGLEPGGRRSPGAVSVAPNIVGILAAAGPNWIQSGGYLIR